MRQLAAFIAGHAPLHKRLRAAVAAEDGLDAVLLQSPIAGSDTAAADIGGSIQHQASTQPDTRIPPAAAAALSRLKEECAAMEALASAQGAAGASSAAVGGASSAVPATGSLMRTEKRQGGQAPWMCQRAHTAVHKGRSTRSRSSPSCASPATLDVTLGARTSEHSQ